MEIHKNGINNLNGSFKGKIDIEKDLFAVIDESGDEGFEFEKSGVTKWFNVSALMATQQTMNEMVEYIRNYRIKRNLQRDIPKMSAKELTHTQRKDLFLGLSKYKFLVTHSLFHKPSIDPRDRMATYPSMYFIGVKNVLERITWCAKQSGKQRVHILISNRNSIKAEDLKRYLFETSVKVNNNLAYREKIGIVRLSNIGLMPQLLLADYAAFSLRLAFEETGNPPCNEPYYFDWYQKGKLYSSKHTHYSGVWGNGLKLVPGNKDLLNAKSDILD